MALKSNIVKRWKFHVYQSWGILLPGYLQNTRWQQQGRQGDPIRSMWLSERISL